MTTYLVLMRRFSATMNVKEDKVEAWKAEGWEEVERKPMAEDESPAVVKAEVPEAAAPKRKRKPD